MRRSLPGSVADQAEAGRATSSDVLLDVRDLTVEVRAPHGWLPVVDRLNLLIPRGQTIGVVGESGSGKSLTALAIMGLLDGVTARIASGRILLGGRELTGLSQNDMSAVRGREIAMIFQEPRRSLHPAFSVGHQIAEVVKRHFGVGRSEARRRAIELLERVGINDAAKRVDAYPHQFSGGMCQRVMLAIALAGEPSFLIADEPTTALDVTVQKRMLDLIRTLQDEENLSVMLITHDMGVVAEMCDLIAVMYCGQMVEHSPLYTLFSKPRHPYTVGLLDSIPSSGSGCERLHAIEGVVPPIATWSSSCRFHTRCEHAVEGRCDLQPNPLRAGPDGNFVRCMRLGELEDNVDGEES